MIEAFFVVEPRRQDAELWNDKRSLAREILIDETTRVLGRDASFLRARLTIRRRNGTPNWDANIGVAGTAVVAAYLQALEHVKARYDLD